MADYIKRESALRAIEDSARPFVKTMANDAYWAYKAVEKVPAEDVEKVVRCKDCKWWKRDNDVEYQWMGYCYEWCARTRDSGHCYLGER